jgi:thiamine biosynthesis protein ThiI
MIHILVDNLKLMLEREEIPYHKYQLSNDSTRIFFFFNNKDLPRAIEVINRAFGVYSVSPAIRTSNRMKNIIERTLEIADKTLNKNDTFALRVKRSGNHEFTSQDVARKAGQAILDNFPELNLTVNLGDPEKVIYIEVRGEFTYVFTDILISKWKGLPIKESRKVLVMDNGRVYDLLAGMFLMRRGCNIKPILFKLTEKEEEWNKRMSNWGKILNFTHFSKIQAIQIDLTNILDHVRKKMGDIDLLCGICRLARFRTIERILEGDNSPLKDYKALTDGITYDNLNVCPDEIDLQSIALCKPLLFTPLIGLDIDEIETHLSSISEDLMHIDYCDYKPNDQHFDEDSLEDLFKTLKIDDYITRALRNKKEIIIKN